MIQKREKNVFRRGLIFCLAAVMSLSGSLSYSGPNTSLPESDEPLPRLEAQVDEYAQYAAEQAYNLGEKTKALSNEAQLEIERWAQESMVDDEITLRIRRLYVVAMRDALVKKMETNAYFRSVGLMNELDSDTADIAINALEFGLLSGALALKLKNNVRFTRWMKTNRGSVGKKVSALKKELKALEVAANKKLPSEKAKLQKSNQSLLKKINKVVLANGGKELTTVSINQMTPVRFNDLPDSVKANVEKVKANVVRGDQIARELLENPAKQNAARASLSKLEKKQTSWKNSVRVGALRYLLRAGAYTAIFGLGMAIIWDGVDSIRVKLSPGAIKDLPRFIQSYNDEIENIDLKLAYIEKIEAIQ